MRFLSVFLVGATLSAPAFAAGTDPVIVYPYATSHNYCPAGLQPVTISGVICCGTPTTNVTYQRAKAAPVRRAKRRSAEFCPVGAKGC